MRPWRHALVSTGTHGCKGQLHATRRLEWARIGLRIGPTISDAAARCRPAPLGCPPLHRLTSSLARGSGTQASRWPDADQNMRAKALRRAGRRRMTTMDARG
jgi:hypothetical protein